MVLTIVKTRKNREADGKSKSDKEGKRCQLVENVERPTDRLTDPTAD